jgi:hypothetical protein
LVSESGCGLSWEAGDGLAFPLTARLSLTQGVRYRSLTHDVEIGGVTTSRTGSSVTLGTGLSFSFRSRDLSGGSTCREAGGALRHACPRDAGISGMETRGVHEYVCGAAVHVKTIGESLMVEIAWMIEVVPPGSCTYPPQGQTGAPASRCRSASVWRMACQVSNSPG